jgi:HD superfamily phosphohydrolase
MDKDEKYKVRDPIYGFISFNELEKDVIAQPAFQRLRRIRQLGIADMVYPGGVHSRFEHSLGVMHLATLMYDSMIKNERNRQILIEKKRYSDAGFGKNRQLIRLAALLHDIGHAPFSHASEDIMPLDESDKPYNHEYYTAAIIKSLLKDVIEDHPYNESNYDVSACDIAGLIEGNSSLGSKLFWKILISSQLDADRGDYLLRDSHHVGVKYGVYDHLRLINTLSLGIDPESQEVILGIDEDGWHVAEALVIARYQMFTQVYFHKTVRAYQYHLEGAMKSVLPGSKLPGPSNLGDFIKLDDATMWNLFKETYESDPDCRSILNRDHIRLVYSTSEIPTPEEIAKKDQKKDKLESKGMWVFEDGKAKKSWYTLNEKGTEDPAEIMIINDGKAKPLSDLSLIAKNIKGMNQIRLYVKQVDRDTARGILDE